MPQIETMTITEFLEARITGDEVAAKKAIEWIAGGPNPGVAWYNEVNRKTFGGAYNLIATHTPARVLAECAAKRAVLAGRERIDRSANDGEWSMGYSDANYEALRALASVYADHPDYRQEWARGKH